MATNQLVAYLVLLCLPMPVCAQHQHKHDSAGPKALEGMDHASSAMSSREMQSTAHMRMTSRRELHPGDQQRANEVLDAVRQALEAYRDYHAAERDGFRIFLANVPQTMYHFTNYWYAFEAAFRFNPEHPTSLLYEKTASGGYKLIGAMYTAPYQASLEELDSRIPLSIAQWHLHTNLCAPPKGRESEYFARQPRFGLQGSISTKQECEQAGGQFHGHVFGWMVHVYPFEKNPAAAWSVERQMDHHH